VIYKLIIPHKYVAPMTKAIKKPPNNDTPPLDAIVVNI
jgi:hypothetical protein